jgi:uncharacterized repeat protein (TIGR02543 family)
MWEPSYLCRRTEICPPFRNTVRLRHAVALFIGQADKRQSMNTMLSSIRRHHIRASLCLFVVALIAGTTGCVGEASRTVKYDLTIASGEGGSVTEPGEGTFRSDAGRVVDLVATQASGYRFVNWTGNVDTIANPNAASTTITTNGNYSIRANFEETEPTFYTLTVGVTGSGSTSPATGSHTYSAGTVVTITATPASGHRFVNWTGDVSTIDDPDSASTTITIYGSYSITGNFEQTAVTYYTLTMGVTGSGSTSPAVGQHSYAAGTVVPISANPASGYYFSHWTAPAGSFTNTSSATTTFTMPAQDVTVTANFEVAAPYTLTMAVTGSGSTSPAVGQHTYTAGTSVSITANPASGYYFSYWTAPAGSFTNANSATTTFTMPAQNVTVTANFVEGPPGPPDQYTLTMAATGSGSTSPAVGQHTYTAGTMVPIVATAAGGYTFVNWTATAGSFGSTSSATTTFTMPAQAVTVTANFELVPTYALTMAATPPGSGTATDQTGAGPYQPGAQVSIKAQAAAGYSFVKWTATAGSFGSASAAQTTFTMPAQAVTVTAHFETVNFMISAGDLHTVGVKSNGAVVATGYNVHGQCNVGGWTGVIQAAAGGFHTVGLKSDGTVVTTGNNQYGQCNVGGWTDIIQVAADGYHTVGLRSDGAVVAAGYNSYGQCNVDSWTNIIQVTAGGFHTVGLKSDGTMVATGNNWYGQRNVSGWTNIIQVAAGAYHTVGLRSNGTVVAAGDNAHGQCNVGSWTNIIQVAAGGSHTVGLKSDGTVVAVGDNYHGQCNVSGWTGIIQVTAGWQHTVGVKSDGTVTAMGNNQYGQCSVGGWDLN